MNDVNAILVTPTGYRISKMRGGVVPDFTPDLPDDTPVHLESGEAHIVNGVEVMFGMLPIERRWVLDDRGWIVPDHEYKERHLQWYNMHFYMQNKSPDDPTARPIRERVEFLSDTVDSDGIHFILIGFDPHRQADGPVRRVDFEINDPNQKTNYPLTPEIAKRVQAVVVDQEGESRIAAAEAQAADAQERADGLQKQFDDLAKRMDAAPAAKTPKPRRGGRKWTDEEKEAARDRYQARVAAKEADSATAGGTA